MSAYFVVNQPTFYKPNFLLIALFSLVLLSMLLSQGYVSSLSPASFVIPEQRKIKKRNGQQCPNVFFSAEQEVKEIIEQTITLILVAFQQNVSQVNKQ